MELALVDYHLRVSDAQLLQQAQKWGITALEITRGTLLPERRWLGQPEGPALFQQATAATGITLASVSATFAYEWPPIDRHGRLDASALDSFLHLAEQTASIGARQLHVPCLEAGAPTTASDRHTFVRSLQPLLDRTATLALTIVLESSWPAVALRPLWEESQDRIHFSYDVGNAIALGGDPLADLTYLGTAVAQWRLRDRRRRDPFHNLPLGHGDVPWNELADLHMTQSTPPALVLAATGGAAALESYQTARRLLKCSTRTETLPRVA